MQFHMAILFAYCIGMKKDHQTLLNFAILAGKQQKCIFSYKVALKNFHGRAKGGASHRGPPPKYATVAMGSKSVSICNSSDARSVKITISYGNITV